MVVSDDGGGGVMVMNRGIAEDAICVARNISKDWRLMMLVIKVNNNGDGGDVWCWSG